MPAFEGLNYTLQLLSALPPIRDFKESERSKADDQNQVKCEKYVIYNTSKSLPVFHILRTHCLLVVCRCLLEDVISKHEHHWVCFSRIGVTICERTGGHSDKRWCGDWVVLRTTFCTVFNSSPICGFVSTKQGPDASWWGPLWVAVMHAQDGDGSGQRKTCYGHGARDEFSWRSIKIT